MPYFKVKRISLAFFKKSRRRGSVNCSKFIRRAAGYSRPTRKTFLINHKNETRKYPLWQFWKKGDVASISRVYADLQYQQRRQLSTEILFFVQNEPGFFFCRFHLDFSFISFSFHVVLLIRDAQNRTVFSTSILVRLYKTFQCAYWM
jgi:hypothetical protein